MPKLGPWTSLSNELSLTERSTQIISTIIIRICYIQILKSPVFNIGNKSIFNMLKTIGIALSKTLIKY